MKAIVTYGFIFLCLVIFQSCERKYEAPGSEVGKICIKVPRTITQVNEALYFGDLSTGVVSRQWSFPPNITDIIDSDNNTTSDKSIVSAMFSQPGTYQVNLHIEFIESLKEEGNYHGSVTLDSSVTITVLDRVDARFVANYIKLNNEDSIDMNMDNNAANPLWMGEFVRYTSLGLGGSTFYQWHFPGGNPEYYEGTDSTVLVQYMMLGQYDVWHCASRKSPDGIDTLEYANIIEVIPTERHARLMSIHRTDAQQLNLTYNLFMDDPSDNTEKFSVSVSNNLVNYPVNIVSASLHSSEPNKILLNLDAPVYDDDLILVSYDTGTFMDQNGRLAPVFTNEITQLTNPLPNIMDTGFEVNPLSWVDAQWVDDPFKPQYYVTGSSNERYHSGNRSLKLEVFPNGGAPLIGPTSYAVEVGSEYRISFWMYIENPGDDRAGSNIRIYSGDWDNEDANYVAVVLVSPSTEWEYYEGIVTPNPENANELYPIIRGRNPGSINSTIVFIDDLEIVRYDRRP